MMFVGAIPRECVEQAFALVDMSTVKDAFVCCSGSFRFEQAISKRFPDVRIHSNDVSLLSTTIGTTACGAPVPFRFKDRLAFLEDTVQQLGGTPVLRAAAMAVALRMCHLRGKNEYIDAHFRHYVDHAQDFVEQTAEKLGPYLSQLRVHDFYAGDFRDHADHALEHGGHVFAWPPLLRGDYERFYRLIHNNTEWEPPAYRLFNPRELPQWLTHLRDSRGSYVVCSDQDFTDVGHKPVALFRSGRAKRIYLYSSVAQATSFWFRETNPSEAFGYNVCNPLELRKGSKVTVTQVPYKWMNFVKDKWQVPGLVHTGGDMSFMVFVDEKLCGGFVYARMSATSNFNAKKVSRLTSIYLLSDFAVDRRAKLSKLVAMLATGQDSVRLFDRKVIHRTETLVTTAFSAKPVSMKYRGIFKLHARGRAKEGAHAPFQLNYISEVRRGSNQAIYSEWFKRYGRAAIEAENANGAAPLRGPEAARGG